MSLRDMDSFDYYTTILQKWTTHFGATIGAAGARTGIAGLILPLAGAGNHYVSRVFDNQPTWIIGTAYRRANWVVASPLIQTWDNGFSVVQGSLLIDTNGHLVLYRGAVAVATSVNVLVPNAFCFIEFKHIIDDVAGLLEAKVNGVLWVTFAGDTKATANAFANTVALWSNDAAEDAHFDDLYILDGVDQSIADPHSPPNNDYLGDRAVRFLAPIGAGNYTNMTPSAGANWQCVDEVPPNEDTDYVEDNVVDDEDTYEMADLPAGSYDIPGIQLIHRVRKVDAGTQEFARLLRHTATDDQGVDKVLSTSYLYYLEILGGDPIAAGAWTKANIDAMEVGQKVRD